MDYHFGYWTTLDITGVSHDLLVLLSDVHLIYMGEGLYGLLTKHNKPLPDVKHPTAKSAYSPESTPTTPCDTELKTIENLQPPDVTNTTGIYSDSTESYVHNEINTSSDTILYSSDTEIYVQTDYNRNIPIRSQEKDNKAKKKTKRTNASKTLQNRTSHSFKCPVQQCEIRKPTRKDITRHYKRKHNILNICTICNRAYITPHSLQQHKYFHMKRIRNFTCVRCNCSFPFLSQLKIHRLKHLRKLSHECTECSEPFKYRHDMLKH